MRNIQDVAADLDLSPSDIIPWGVGAAKVSQEAAFREDPLKARLVLVSAINPTPAGEGKTTVSIGLTQAARKIGVRAAAALREPSLGPVFGAKGGGTGGGKSQLIPSDRINLHFTGDMHAITSANNLLSALVDNEINFRGPTDIEPRSVTWRRAMDMNDRFLRKMIIGLGGKASGVPREEGFDITAASEVMAVLCLSRDYADLKERLGNIIVGTSRTGQPVRARDVGAVGAMAALLRDAMLPNIVQTLEGAPAVVHGGPFANIAHGCNSVAATRLAMRRADVVFTEAGFGFDLGGEKFLDVKCRAAGIWPHAVVLVATLRALKYHGGVPVADAAKENKTALLAGMANLEKHVESVRSFGLEPIVAINVRQGDAESELNEVVAAMKAHGVEAGAADVFGQGGAGATALVEKIIAKAKAADTQPKFTYELSDAPTLKIEKICKNIYGAKGVTFTTTAKQQIDKAVELGFGESPVIMAKTHLSLTDNEKKIGRPRDFEMTVREVRVSAGAGFLVALTGEIMTMPGLAKVPHARDIELTDDGNIIGVT